ncbi:HAD family hydrolase [Streptomyces liangshanensis]|uniref:HAD-IA family hydrolase n=1 Tax=Streptomyces liangshanensis TaxID=2717324 RepID=A0A6G9H1V5_9ACTN|nr:HAD-IA family hydrolase [Streptomyces liangshanensis]QIQ04454.1 HAD-IA family hydrolase [Streptomyces liangshanensis]
MRLAKPRLIVLDFDGVLLDTERIAVEEWQRILHRERVDLPAPLPVRTDATLDRGALGARLISLLGKRRSDGLWEEFERENRRRADEEPLLPGVAAFLDACRREGRVLALASGNSRDWVEGHLDRLGVREHFAAVTCAGPDIAAKPAPDAYRAVLRECGAAPGTALAVEDSFAGLLAARAAGLPVVWVTSCPPGVPAPTEVESRVRDLGELAFAA